MAINSNKIWKRKARMETRIGSIRDCCNVEKKCVSGWARRWHARYRDTLRRFARWLNSEEVQDGRQKRTVCRENWIQASSETCNLAMRAQRKQVFRVSRLQWDPFFSRNCIGLARYARSNTVGSFFDNISYIIYFLWEAWKGYISLIFFTKSSILPRFSKPFK